MAYDEELANRVRQHVHEEPGLTEKRMFGGLAFLINGNMAVSASGQGGLLLRVDPVQTETLLSQPHAQPFTMRGRAMDGWLRIDTDALDTDDSLQQWIHHGVAYARSLPPK
jgi:TfoX/Sxy family transcriptional regulator of competence genes